MSATSRLTVRLLGPLEVFVGARPVKLTTGRLRTVMVTLALSAGRAVTVDRLAAAVWGPDLPVDVRRTISTYMTRLRTALGAASITFDSDGYGLRVTPDDVDGLRFARLLNAAAQATDPTTETELLDNALALWRGLPFERVRSAWLEESEAPRITEWYLSAVERRADLRLMAGAGAELVPQLGELTARFPLRESLSARLLVALDRCGRPVEGLGHYEKIRAHIAGHLGVDPGPELQGIYRLLLARTLPQATTGEDPTGRSTIATGSGGAGVAAEALVPSASAVNAPFTALGGCCVIALPINQDQIDEDRLDGSPVQRTIDHRFLRRASVRRWYR